MYLPQSGGRSSGHYKDAVKTSQGPGSGHANSEGRQLLWRRRNCPQNKGGRQAPPRCPLWVTGGHRGMSSSCPLYPPKADIGARDGLRSAIHRNDRDLAIERVRCRSNRQAIIRASPSGSMLWVISGHKRISASCQLYPRKRTFTDASSMSACAISRHKNSLDGVCHVAPLERVPAPVRIDSPNSTKLV
jgi:hypothetical protein